MEQVFYNIPDECSNVAVCWKYFTGNQTEHTCFIVLPFRIMM